MAIVQNLQRSIMEKYLNMCEDWVKIWRHAPFLCTRAVFIRPAGCRDQDMGAFSQPRGLHHLQHESQAYRPHTVLASAASFLLIEALAPPLKHRNATSTPWQRSFYSGKQSNSSPDGGFGALTAQLCWIGTTCWAESLLLAGVFLNRMDLKVTATRSISTHQAQIHIGSC